VSGPRRALAQALIILDEQNVPPRRPRLPQRPASLPIHLRPVIGRYTLKLVAGGFFAVASTGRLLCL